MIPCINLVELNISTRISIYSCYRHKDTKFFNKIGEINTFIPLHEKFLQFDWLRAVIFQLNLKYLHVKITNLLRVVV